MTDEEITPADHEAFLLYHANKKDLQGADTRSAKIAASILDELERLHERVAIIEEGDGGEG